MDLVSRTYVDRVEHAQPKTGIRDRNEQGLLVEKMFFAPIGVKFVLDKPFHRTTSQLMAVPSNGLFVTFHLSTFISYESLPVWSSKTCIRL